MAEKKYEKYIIREAMRPGDFMDPMAAGFMTMPPLIFLNGDRPVQGSNQFLEVVWIWAEGAAAVNPDRPPHSHEFDEVFVFLGSNQKEPNDLGGEVEFWLGEGKDTEKYRFTTSTCIFVPKGLVHLPMIFKNIKRPFLLVTFGVNMGKEWVRAKAPRK
jgi:mannose-6-phosphate isomerase-like protein (cupin superfamily)